MGRTLCVFNPEHDLCLANGGLNFMPPRSALQFAEKGVELMHVLYGDGAICTCSSGAGLAFEQHADVDNIVAWGWNRTLKNQLLKQGIPIALLPTDEAIEWIRTVSHRTTAMPMANRLNGGYSVECIDELYEVELLLKRCPQIVLKAPWSGSGRGLRWVTDKMTQQDENWVKKMIREQRCVMAEKRHRVVQNFALEYVVDVEVEWIGYSLFEVQNGVYRGNRLWRDEEILHCLSQYISIAELHSVEAKLSGMLSDLLVGRYRGPLGVDMMVAEDEKGYYLVSVVEINFRHTMGMVAHRLTELYPSRNGQLWAPTL